MEVCCGHVSFLSHALPIWKEKVRKHILKNHRCSFIGWWCNYIWHMTTVGMATSSKQPVHAHTGLLYVAEFMTCLLFCVNKYIYTLNHFSVQLGMHCHRVLPRYEPACCSVCGRFLLCKLQVNNRAPCFIMNTLSPAHPYTLTFTHTSPAHPHTFTFTHTHTTTHVHPPTQYPDVWKWCP